MSSRVPIEDKSGRQREYCGQTSATELKIYQTEPKTAKNTLQVSFAWSYIPEALRIVTVA